MLMLCAIHPKLSKGFSEMSFAHYGGSLTGQIFSVSFWNKQRIYGHEQLAEPKLKDFDSFQSHLSLSV